MLAGPMDYTPGGFNNAFRDEYMARYTNPMTQGTRCHQLAMYVVYESPLQMLPDAPVNYRGQKGLDFIRVVPTVWDDTRFIDGEVADYIVLARRKGEVWYLGAMTDWDAREVTVPLSFLGTGSWRLRSWVDGSSSDARAVETTESMVNADETMTIKMESGGGFAAIIEPAR
jgi:alpha-glucosidase